MRNKNIILKFAKIKLFMIQKKGKESRHFIDRTGEVHIMNTGQVLTIIKYDGWSYCTIQFEDKTILTNIDYGNISKKTVKNPNNPSIFGVGYRGIGKYSKSKTRKDKIRYSKWYDSLRRCYCDKHLSLHPSYIGCSVDEHWHNFQNFAKWFDENYNSEYMEGWELDKDILIKGNKIYSPETCCFVPPEINSLFTKNNKNRGDCPIGVSIRKSTGKISADIRKHGVNVPLGTFSTVEEAFKAYKIAKEEYIKEIADKWKDKIHPKVYTAMYNYQVEITD